ncbi:zinc-dependent alcohol dehydrogenase [Halioxenophilus sp. WMMB6]|uniref:zinc-dependent alcohol dehydrogenase n=1 Tax=Halioxenophilus sp. WMMB6 TaxID=3073815 RepID=UPI00295F0977|nr:alcohol dehydrogenase catalytic domain-containing protein [Halioxenophilus sp. WMMB6]
MRAAVYPGQGQTITIQNLPDPTPGATDLIIRVHRCGICGTDLHLTSGHHFDFPANSVLGHEYAGEVVAVGSAVTNFKIGDLITALPSTGCGQVNCPACREGNLTLCRAAPGVVGGFAELLRVPAAVAVKLPNTLSQADGALIEPMAVGLYGIQQSGMQVGDRVVVLGAGTVALCAIYWAKRLGAGRIVAVSRSPRRAELVGQMGGDGFVCSGEHEAERIAQALGGPADIVLECVGAEGFLAHGLALVRPLGKLVSLGFCTAPDSFIPAIAGMKGVSLLFPVGYTLRDFEHVARTMDNGHVDPKLLISKVVGLDDLPATFALLRRPHRETKVQVAPNPG